MSIPTPLRRTGARLRFPAALGAFLLLTGACDPARTIAVGVEPQKSDTVAVIEALADEINRRRAYGNAHPSDRRYAVVADTARMPSWLWQPYVARLNPSPPATRTKPSECPPVDHESIESPLIRGDSAWITHHSRRIAPEAWGLGSSGHTIMRFAFVRHDGVWRPGQHWPLQFLDATCRVVGPVTEASPTARNLRAEPLLRDSDWIDHHKHHP